MTDFDYKKYSLENLSKWAEDSLTAAEATPQEIYNTIHKVVEENYYYHKHHASRAYELMELLNGSNHLVCDKDDKSPECQKAWNDFWGDVDEREYNIREAEYYNKRAELDAKPNKWIHTSIVNKICKRRKTTKTHIPLRKKIVCNIKTFPHIIIK